MPNDIGSFIAGVVLLVLYLDWSAATEMGAAPSKIIPRPGLWGQVRFVGPNPSEGRGLRRYSVLQEMVICSVNNRFN